jgi:FG-GAP-like repeat
MNGANRDFSVKMVPNAINPGWNFGAAKDFNGDGQIDLVWQATAGNPIVLWYMNNNSFTGTSAVLNPLGSPSDPAWRLKAAGDLDGNGTIDLFFQQLTPGPTNNVSVWYMNGTTLSEARALPFVNVGWDLKAAADFDRDGVVDLLWEKISNIVPGDIQNGNVVVWLMRPDGSVRTGLVVQSPDNPPIKYVDPAWRASAVRDVNGDLTPDIWWEHSQGNLSVWALTYFPPAAPGGERIVWSGIAPTPSSVPTSWQIIGPR